MDQLLSHLSLDHRLAQAHGNCVNVEGGEWETLNSGEDFGQCRVKFYVLNH